MSRHKLVKALDLSEELDDFDGGAESDYEEEVAAEDREQLRAGTVKVRDVLGTDIPVSDKEIENALWHYYYDIEKTVNYLRCQKTKAATKPKPKPKSSIKRESITDGPITPAFDSEGDSTSHKSTKHLNQVHSGMDFFSDAPWLNVARERLAEIRIEPLHPKNGLLGGTSKQDSHPKSKLAALAAARKKKESQKAEDGKLATNAVTLLDKLGTNTRAVSSTAGTESGKSNNSTKSARKDSDIRPKQYPAQIHSDITSPGKAQYASPDVRQSQPVVTTEVQPVAFPIASPSIFAKTIFDLDTGVGSHIDQVLSFHSGRAFVDETEFNFADPSPDDIVLEAQNSKGEKQKAFKQKPQPANDNQISNDIVEQVKGVSIDDTKVRRKNFDVLAEFKKSKPKKSANFVVIGHVDAGKSTLMGRLLQDVDAVDQRTVDKYRKEADRLGKSSFALAWVLDQGTEERERGVTMDVALKNFETENTKFTILDAPGHRDFIPNMIAGASQADLALLVIDASIGNYESGLKGQTKEHALLVRSIGVQRVVIAVNKLDTVEWSQERFDEISQQVSAFLTSAGFLPKNIAFVPCAGLTGENVVRRSEKAQASWFTGPTLISLLESSEPISRALDKPLRLTIDDIFRGRVQNPLSVSGRVDAGSAQAGDVVQILPANQQAVIKSLEVDSVPAEWIVAGQNVIIHFTDIEAKYLKSGDVMCPPAAPIQCSMKFTVKLLAFEHITPMHCEILRGRLNVPGRITRLLAQLDKASGSVVKGKKPRLIKPGTVARVVFEVDDPIPLEQGGRIIMRAGGETVGAGLVE